MKPIKPIGIPRKIDNNNLPDLDDYEIDEVNNPTDYVSTFPIISYLEDMNDVERDFLILKKMLILNNILTEDQINDLIDTHKVMSKLTNTNIEDLI